MLSRRDLFKVGVASGLVLLTSRKSLVAHAQLPNILMDENFEGTVAQFNSRWSDQSLPPNMFTLGFMTLDTAQKFEGAQSIRFTYNGTQYDTPSHGGGFANRLYGSISTNPNEIWITWYHRFAPGFLIAGANGLLGSGTKAPYCFMKSRSTGVEHGWSFGYNFGSSILELTVQGVKDAAPSGTGGPIVPYDSERLRQNLGVNFAQPFGVWCGYEALMKLGEPGQHNGRYELWATNMSIGPSSTRRVALHQNREFVDTTPQGSMPSDSVWRFQRLYRQDGMGQMWYDRMTISRTRIGVSGSAPASDTTAPAPPQNFRVT